MENLKGRKIRGFKFESSLDLGFDKKMDKYIDEVGDILEVDETSVGVRFKDSQYWYYPKEEALKHLVHDVEIGKCYTITDYDNKSFEWVGIVSESKGNRVYCGECIDVEAGIIISIGKFDMDDMTRFIETPERLPWLEYCIKENKYISEEEFNSMDKETNLEKAKRLYFGKKAKCLVNCEVFEINGLLQEDSNGGIWNIFDNQRCKLFSDGKWAEIIEDKEIDSPKNEEVYNMCKPQSVQLDCRKTKCKYYTGGGHCSNVSPAITINENGTVVCWSENLKQIKRMTLNEALNILADKLGVYEIDIID